MFWNYTFHIERSHELIVYGSWPVYYCLLGNCICHKQFYSIQQLVMYVLAYTNGAFRWTVSYEGLYCVYLQLGISDVTLGILDTTIPCTPFMCFLKLLHLSTQFMHSTPSCQRQVRCTSTIHEYERNWCAPSSIFMHACVVIWIQF